MKLESLAISSPAFVIALFSRINHFLDHLLGRDISRRYRFAVAGAPGFGVTEVVLALGFLVFYGRFVVLHASFSSPGLLGLDVLSLVVGVTASFVVNERITINVPRSSDSPGGRLRGFLEFQAVSGVGNMGIIVVQLLLFAAPNVSPILGSIMGAIVTYPMVYFVSVQYVWRGSRQDCDRYRRT